MDSNKHNFLEVISILFKWRKLIIWNFFIISIVAIGISFIIPRWFSASTTILIPSKEGMDFGISSFLKKIPSGGLGFGLDALSDDASLYVAILKSRTIKEEIINKFNLIKRYKAKNIEEALKDLNDYYSVDINEDGTITLSASAKTSYFPTKRKDEEARLLSKEMATFFVAQLDLINKNLKIERARNSRIFIEKRYITALSDLHQKEEEFKNYQQQHGTISLSEQTSATIKVAAELKVKIITKEIELGVLNNSFGYSNSENNRIQQEINELQSKYNDLINFSDGNTDKPGSGSNEDIFLPLENLPDLGLNYVRLLRDITIQEKIIEFLLPQYEQAKIQEAKDTPTLQILDEAKIPIKKSKPKRILFVLLIDIIGAIFTIIFIFSIEKLNYHSEKRTSQYLMYNKMIEELKADVHFIKNRK